MKKRPKNLETTGELTDQAGLLIVDPYLSEYLEIPDITAPFIREYIKVWRLQDYSTITPGHPLFEEIASWALALMERTVPPFEVHEHGEKVHPDPELSKEENARWMIKHFTEMTARHGLQDHPENIYTARITGSRYEAKVDLDTDKWEVVSLRLPVLTQEAEELLRAAPVIPFEIAKDAITDRTWLNLKAGEYGRVPDGTTYRAKKIGGPAARTRGKVEALFEKLNERQIEGRDLASKQGQLMCEHFKAQGGPAPKFIAYPSGMMPTPEPGVEYPGIDPEATPVEQVRLILVKLRLKLHRASENFRDMDVRIKELAGDIDTLEKEINKTLWALAFEYWRHHNPVPVEPSVYEGREVAPLPTGGPMWSGVRALMHPSRWEDVEGVLVYQQTFEDGRTVTHFVASADDMEGRPDRLAGEAAWSIVQSFGILTARLHLLFASHAWDQEKPWEGSFTLDGDSMIKDLGLDKRTDLTYGKKLKDVVKHAGLLGNLGVRTLWREAGKPYNVRSSRMWDIALDTPYSQPSLLEDGEEDYSSVMLTVRPGLWTEKFMNRGEGGLFQFGYMAREVLSIDPYHEEMAAELAILLTFQARVKLAKGQAMDFKAGTLLVNILGEDQVAEISRESKKQYDYMEKWDRALLTLKDNRWTIEFDQDTYPEDLRPAWALEGDLHLEKRRRPRGYWSRLLRAHIIITPPAPIPALLEKIGSPRKQRPRTLPPPRLTGKAVREAREKAGLTQKELAEKVGKSQPWIAAIERETRSIKPEDQDRLIEALYL